LGTVDGSRGSTIDDDAMLTALRAGDEAAFTRLVERYHDALTRVAMTYVRDRHVAEEVVQDSWIAVIRGIDGFEGRSSLSTWIFRIVTYQARSRGDRERRTVPLSAFEAGPDEPSVDPTRFRPVGAPWAGHWWEAPRQWGPDASERLLTRETQSVIVAALDGLPESQRTVLTLRDINGYSSEEVCERLEISAGNQRVLLHRARTRVRAALEAYFSTTDAV
jgi:RNA polymerase sigma-70 factor (ECF subfamily)